MQAILKSIIAGLITAKADEINDTKQIIEAHQKEWEKLEKEKEALEQLLAILPDLEKAAFERNVTQGFNKERPHYFESGGKLPDLFKEVKETKQKIFPKSGLNFGEPHYYSAITSNEEKINTANVRNWQSKNVPPMHKPPKKESETVTALIPKSELLKYVRTQPSLFPNEKPVHIFIADGNEYEFIYLSASGEIPAALLRNLTFDHTEIPVPHIASIWYIFKHGIDTFPFELKKRTGTNNY